MPNKVTTNVKVARVNDILKFLHTTHTMFEGVLHTLEEAEMYEECADILNDINEIKEEIHKYETYRLIEEQTGRQFKVTEFPSVGLPNDNKTG